MVTVSDTRTLDDDRSGTLIADALTVQRGAPAMPKRRIVRDERAEIEAAVRDAVADADVDVVITTGGTGFAVRDVTPEAVEALATRTIPGFGELFRRLSFEEVGTSTIQSRAEAYQCDRTFVFVSPAPPARAAWPCARSSCPSSTIRHRPCNFAELLPRVDSRKSTGSA